MFIIFCSRYVGQVTASSQATGNKKQQFLNRLCYSVRSRITLIIINNNSKGFFTQRVDKLLNKM